VHALGFGREAAALQTSVEAWIERAGLGTNLPAESIARWQILRELSRLADTPAFPAEILKFMAETMLAGRLGEPVPRGSPAKGLSSSASATRTVREKAPILAATFAPTRTRAILAAVARVLAPLARGEPPDLERVRPSFWLLVAGVVGAAILWLSPSSRTKESTQTLAVPEVLSERRVPPVAVLRNLDGYKAFSRAVKNCRVTAVEDLTSRALKLPNRCSEAIAVLNDLRIAILRLDETGSQCLGPPLEKFETEMRILFCHTNRPAAGEAK
jgi:hypothetical protein